MLLAFAVVCSILALPPHNISLLGYVALVGLIKISVEASSRRRAFAYGLAYGILFIWGSNLWVLNLSLIGWLASCWVGLFYATYSLLISKSTPRAWSPLWWSSCWVAVEAIRTALIPFGWNPLSSMTSNISLLQNASWGSQYIISFALCLTSATVALLLMKTTRIVKITSSGLTLMFLAGLFTFGNYRLKSLDSLGDNAIERIPMTIMSSKEPFTATLEGRWEILENHIRRTKDAKSPYLNVWPESIGFPLLNHQPSWDAIKELTKEINGPILITPSHVENGKIYNSSILLENQASEAQIYKKRFLTPIGEYIPPFVPKSLVYSQRHPGKEDGNLTLLVTDSGGTRPYRVGMLICLEETLSKAAFQSLNAGAEVFISPSNHGDTGKDCALQQERMGQIRAIETCTPLVRIGNIGDSNVFDFAGREIFRDNGAKMSTVSVPILKEKSYIFPSYYIFLQSLSLWILIAFCFTGLIINNFKKD